MAANAFHVLFENMQQSGMDAKTFGVSIYEDGSIKMSYLSDALYDERDFFGLWGSFVSTSPSFLRYHSETLETVELLNGTDTVFCPLNTTACVQEACISPSNMLSINWNGTNTCNALGPNIKYSLECQWYGGMATSNASLYVRTSASTHSGVLTCAVPIFNVTDGTVIPVEILQIIEYGDNVSNVSYRPQQLLYGSKFVHGVYISPSTEITRANLMVRYFSSGSVNKCGCNALEDYSQMSCNSQNICAYGAAKFAEDCAGTPFGSAYFDACGKCAGGYTKQIPVFQCSVDDDQFLSLITQTIILLVIICCLTLITSSVSYAIRRMLVQRATNEAMLAENEMALQMLEVNVGSAGSSRRGLSEFECEALGLVVFTKSLLKKDNLPGKDDEAAQNDSNDCPICLMELQEGIICRMLPEPCGHIFHQQCIDQWFKQSTVCPLCKRSMKMVFEEEHVHERPSGTRRHVADGSNVDSVGRIRDFMSNRRPRNHGNYSNVNDNNSYLPAESSQVVQSRSAEPGTYEI